MIMIRKTNDMRVVRYCIALLIVSLIFGMTLAFSSELAKVDNVVITEKDLKQRIELLPERSRRNIDKEKLLDKLIDEELLVREAKKLNFHKKEDYKSRIDSIERELLVDFYLRQLLKDNNTEANQKNYYEKNKEKYKNPEMVRISVIRLPSEEEAKNIIKKAEEGQDFAELARKYSKGPASEKGGDYGFRSRRSLQKELADVAFSMKKGEIKGPIKTQDGYYVINLTDRKEEGIAKFEDVKAMVANEYARELIHDKITELREAAKIHIDAAELKNLKID
jgi:peptidyl-prolyl cis-trans isomerase C